MLNSGRMVSELLVNVGVVRVKNEVLPYACAGVALSFVMSPCSVIQPLFR
jgi:hypothetical protein